MRRLPDKGAEGPPLERQQSYDPSQAVVEDETEEDIDWSVVDKEQYQEVRSRFDDYKEAAQYFISVSFNLNLTSIDGRLHISNILHQIGRKTRKMLKIH